MVVMIVCGAWNKEAGEEDKGSGNTGFNWETEQE